MHGRVMLASVAGMLALSGCASMQSAQELERLKSDVGLLDQRVGQLERASLRDSGPQASQGPVADAQTAPAMTPAAVPAMPAPAAAKTAGPASVKPTKREIQQALRNAGFYQGTIDGKIGPQTREAIRTFQQIHGLKADGVVGKQTWEKLSPYLEIAAGTGEIGASESTIK